MKKMSLKSASIELGKHETFFHNMRRNLYKYILSLEGRTIVDKYRKYQKDVTRTIGEYNKLPRRLYKADKSVNWFSIQVARRGIYKSPRYYGNNTFEMSNEVRFNRYLAMKKILQLADELLNDK